MVDAQTVCVDPASLIQSGGLDTLLRPPLQRMSSASGLQFSWNNTEHAIFCVCEPLLLVPLTFQCMLTWRFVRSFCSLTGTGSKKSSYKSTATPRKKLEFSAATSISTLESVPTHPSRPITTGPYNVLFHHFTLAPSVRPGTVGAWPASLVLITAPQLTDSSSRDDTSRLLISALKFEFMQCAAHMHQLFARCQRLLLQQPRQHAESSPDSSSFAASASADGLSSAPNHPRALRFLQHPELRSIAHVQEMAFRLISTTTHVRTAPSVGGGGAPQPRRAQSLISSFRSPSPQPEQVGDLLLSYWVVGRLFAGPPCSQCFVCYHDSIPQRVVELAFNLNAEMM